MIIGKDQNYKELPSFENKFKKINEQTNICQNNFTPNLDSKKFKDPTNTNEIKEKSFNMLVERYNNGLMSLEEFTKKCHKLNKQ